jgi:hypothetical protein
MRTAYVPCVCVVVGEDCAGDGVGHGSDVMERVHAGGKEGMTQKELMAKYPPANSRKVIEEMVRTGAGKGRDCCIALRLVAPQYLCTREKGHKGYHAVHRWGDAVVCVWDDKGEEMEVEE